MNPWLAGSVLIPLHERAMRRPTFRAFRELLDARQASEDELRALRTRKLRALLAHASETPFYRRRIDATGADARGDDPWAVLAALEPVSRDEIRESSGEMTSSSAGPLTPGATSGSSGDPLHYYLSRHRAAYDKASRYRAWRDWGVAVGDRKAWLWGISNPGSWTTRIKTLRDRLTNEIVIGAYNLTAPKMREAIERLRRYRPRCVTCYPSAGWRLARFAEAEGLSMKGLGITVFFCTGEMLDDRYREVIERVSGARVANEYGMREAGLVAHQCPHGTLHTMPETMVVETRRADGAITRAGDGGGSADAAGGTGVAAGGVGELVVTNLESFGMPMIRYRTRDYGAVGRGRCPCGWNTDIVEGLSGRQNDFLIASDGTPVVGFVLSRGFWSVPGVTQFNVVQETIGRTRVQVVARPEAFGRDARKQIEALVRGALGPSVEVPVEVVDAIPAQPSGKSRYIESRIAGEYL